MKHAVRDIKDVLNDFKSNKFDPKFPSPVVDLPGNYLFCLIEGSELPATKIIPEIVDFEGLQVIYTGIAGKSLKNRDTQQHFKGNANASTVRLSLGSLFGYKKKYSIDKENKKKWRYSKDDEDKLSRWMKDNLVLYYRSSKLYKEEEVIEKQLINYFNPPLNLKHNVKEINIDFRKFLKNLRSNKKKN